MLSKWTRFKLTLGELSSQGRVVSVASYNSDSKIRISYYSQERTGNREKI